MIFFFRGGDPFVLGTGMFSYFIQWHNLYWYWTTDQYSSSGEIRMSKMSFFSHHTTTKNIAVSLQSFRGKDEYDLFFKTFWLVNLHHRDCSLNIFNPCVCFFRGCGQFSAGLKSVILMVSVYLIIAQLNSPVAKHFLIFQQN